MKASKYFLTICIFLLLTGCGESGVTRISTLVMQTRDYDMLKVTTEGKVGRTAGFLGLGVFELKDNDGAILYVLTDRGIPEPNSVTNVSGTFKQVVKSNTISYNVIVENERIDLPLAVKLIGLLF